MEVTQVSVADLGSAAAPYNPRQISDHDLAALRESLRVFGTVEPIVVNKRTGRIVGGHQRVRAASAEGIDTLPVVYVDLDAVAEKQLNLALNRIHGEWDTDRLASVLGDLESASADLKLTGFTDAEIEDLCRGDSTSMLRSRRKAALFFPAGQLVSCLVSSVRRKRAARVRFLASFSYRDCGQSQENVRRIVVLPRGCDRDFRTPDSGTQDRLPPGTFCAPKT